MLDDPVMCSRGIADTQQESSPTDVFNSRGRQQPMIAQAAPPVVGITIVLVLWWAVSEALWPRQQARAD